MQKEKKLKDMGSQKMVKIKKNLNMILYIQKQKIN